MLRFHNLFKIIGLKIVLAFFAFGTAAHADTASEGKALVERYYAAVESENWNALVPLFRDNSVFHVTVDFGRFIPNEKFTFTADELVKFLSGEDIEDQAEFSQTTAAINIGEAQTSGDKVSVKATSNGAYVYDGDPGKWHEDNVFVIGQSNGQPYIAEMTSKQVFR